MNEIELVPETSHVYVPAPREATNRTTLGPVVSATTLPSADRILSSSVGRIDVDPALPFPPPVLKNCGALEAVPSPTVSVNFFTGCCFESEPVKVVVVMLRLRDGDGLGDGEGEGVPPPPDSAPERKTLFATSQCQARYEPGDGDVLK